MIRDAFVSAAQGLVGLTEPSPELGALVDPGGDPAHQCAVERESLCELTARGLWLRILDAAGAARVPTLDAPPASGDALWWAANGSHVEHVDACVVMVATGGRYPTTERADELLLSVVAGGQRDGAGHETITMLARTLHWDGSAWVCQATGRRLRWVLDCEALAAYYGMRNAS